MIAYLDTSALLKLYVDEQGSDRVRTLVEEASMVAVCTVAYAEARAALARVRREGMLPEKGYRSALAQLYADWSGYYRLDVNDDLLRLAGDLVEQFPLRGFDAIHLAAAHILRQKVNEPVAVGCWDVRLWEAAHDCGFSVVPEEKPGQAHMIHEE